MDRVFIFIEEWTGLSPVTQGRILLTLVIVLILVLVSRWMQSLLRRKVADLTQRYYWSRVVTYAVVLLGILIIARVWVEGIQPLFTYLGIFGAGLAIAMHDTVANIVGWIFILWRRPFQVGDRVEIGGTIGDVIDIRLFQFSVLEVGQWVDADQSTGRIVHIPNGKVQREPLANYTKGFKYIWHEIPVLITFESNWKAAREILEEIVREHVDRLSAGAEEQIRQAARKYMIFYGKLTPIVYLTVRDSGVQLTMRFMVNPRRRRGTEEEIWEAILEEFGQRDDIEFAYPTIRYFDNRMEGGQGPQAP